MPSRERLSHQVRALCTGLRIHDADLRAVLSQAQREGLHPDEVAAVAREAAGRELRLRCGHALEGLRVVGQVGSFCGACVAEWSP